MSQAGRVSPWIVLRCAFIVCACIFATGAAEIHDEGLEDPYLKFRPLIARSLPMQVLLTGIVLALSGVLFIYLCFTAQYHLPLAPTNFVLQLSGVTTLLVSLIATLHVVFQTSISESLEWPYSLNWIAVSVPPSGVDNDGWSTTEKAMWFTMTATTSILVQTTHIQFLTLLYPSKLEWRLIFFILGPLSVVSAVMQLLPISSDRTVKFYASAIRNVCDATLSLLFTAFLLIWGLLINRSQAWRTDGGTAAFGAAALVLALVSTALNLLYIPREEEFVWLPALIWVVTLWQSFLGWWWWVGAGSGTAANGKERNRRDEERERRKRERGLSRQKTRDRAKLAWRGVAGVLSQGRGESNTSGRSSSPTRSPVRRTSRRTRTGTSSSENEHDNSDATTYLPHFLPAFVHQWYADVRYDHQRAARAQAAERIRRIQEIGRNSNLALPVGTGWGLGSFGWRTEALDEPRDAPDVRSRRRRSTADASEVGEEGFELETMHELGNTEDVEGEIVEPRALEDGRRYPPSMDDRASTTPRAAGRSMGWWEPLQRWRLKDSTTY